MNKADAPTDRLLSLMFELGRKLKAAFARALGPYSMIDLETLRFVTEAGSPTMREIAEYLKVAAPSATDIADGLAKKGYLKRILDSKDRRKVRLCVTKKGERFISDCLKKREQVFAELLAPLRGDDRRELARILAIITAD